MRRALLASLAVLVGCPEDPQTGLSQTTPLVTSSTDQVDFGRTYVTLPVTRTVNVRSSGNGDVRLTRVALEGPPELSMAPANDDRLTPGEELVLTVTYSPEAAGRVEGAIVVENSSVNQPTLRIRLTGEAEDIPSCEDNNPCTDELFDLLEGQCKYFYPVRPCDDGSACTIDDTCSNGQCLGVGVNCADGTDCTDDYCDQLTGCVYIPNNAACSDGEPCTADICEPNVGCRNPVLPNGSVCGPQDGCNSLKLCFDAECNSYPVPEGTPCFDGDFCTIGDKCTGGACVGVREDREPEIDAVLPTFGGARSQAVVLPGPRMVFVDEAWPYGQGPGGKLAYSVVTVEEGRLKHVKTEQDDEDGGRFLVRPLGSDMLLQVREDVTEPVVHIKAFRFLADGDVEEGVALDVPVTNPQVYDVAIADSVAYVAVDQTLVSVDVANPFAPVLLDTLVFDDPAFNGIFVDTARSRLLWLAAWSHFTADITAPGALSTDGVRTQGPFAGPVVPVGALWATFGPGTPDSDRLSFSIVDPEDFSLVYTSWNELEDGFFALAADGNHVFALRRVGQGPQSEVYLRWWDVADPAAPTMVADLLLSDPRDPFDASTTIWAGGGLVGINGSEERGAQVFQVDVVEQALVRLTGDAHGAVHSIVSITGGALALHSRAVHQVSISGNNPPTLVAGGALDVVSPLLGLAEDGVGPLHLVPAKFNAPDPMVVTTETGGILTWTDVVDPTRPNIIGQVQFPDDGRRYMRGDGNVIYSVGVRQGAPRVNAEIVKLNDEPASFERSWDVVSGMEIPTSGEFTSEEGMALGLDAFNKRIVIALNLGSHAELVVLDVANEALTLLAFLRLDDGRYLQSVAISGTTIVTLENAEELPRQFFVGQKLRTFALTLGAEQTINVLGEVDVPESNHFLAFDGRNAFVTTRTGVAFVDTSRTPPAVAGQLETPQSPISGVVAGARIVVGGNTGVVVITPPCFPPFP
ncbi:MAG: hypothetical protein AB2A00_15925 [Myxococcota bacterium]